MDTNCFQAKIYHTFYQNFEVYSHLNEKCSDEEPRRDGVPRGEPAGGEHVGHDLEGRGRHRVAVVGRRKQQDRQLQEHELK